MFIGNFDDGLKIEGLCSCPVGFNCKHVVATCLTYKHPAQPSQTPKAGTIAFSQWLSRLSTITEGRSLEDGGNKEYLLYHLTQDNRGKGIRVTFGVARLKQDGTFGKERGLHFTSLSNRYSVPPYFRPIDEEVTALLDVCLGRYLAHRYGGAHGPKPHGSIRACLLGNAA